MEHRLTALVVCAGLLASLAACGPKGAEPSSAPETTPITELSPTPVPTPVAFRFTRENFPRLDGSTATLPMGRAAAAALLGETEEAVADLVSGFSRTTQSYYNLIEGRADVLLSAEPNQEALDFQAEQGFQWEMEPFAMDAFVFLVNADNPVDSLTVEQIRDIYTGKITNWSELGGEDVEIVAFQRNQGAGSQTLMEKLVMGDLPMMEAPVDWVRSEMGDLMEAVRAFDGSRAAIGYSVYYYAEEMEMAGGLKLLQIDGTAPEPETIRSGEYPLLNPYYVVMSADEDKDGPARAFFDWIRSEPGQALVAESGYVAVHGGSGERPAAEPGKDVVKRWYEEESAGLKPLPEGYGTLIPYPGQMTLGPRGWEFQTNYRMGLMTSEGTVVTDPVFFEAFYNEAGLLTLTTVEALEEGAAARYAIADPRGRWCTGFDYDRVIASEDGVLLCDSRGLSLMGVDGTTLQSWDWSGLGYTQGERPGWASDEPSSWACGMLTLDRVYDQEQNGYVRSLFLNTDTGAVVSTPEGTWAWEYSGDLAICTTQDDRYGYVDKTGAWAIEPRFVEAGAFTGGRAAVRTADGVGQLIDQDGTVLLERPGGGYEILSDGGDGWWYVAYDDGEDYRREVAAAYGQDLKPLDLDPADWEQAERVLNADGCIYAQIGAETVFYRPGTLLRLPSEREPDWGEDIQNSMAALLQPDGTRAVYRLSNGACIVPAGTYASIRLELDEITGEPYLVGSLRDNTQVLMDAEGRVLHTAEEPAADPWSGGYGQAGEQLELRGGLILSVADSAVRIWDREGALLYRRAIYPSWSD